MTIDSARPTRPGHDRPASAFATFLGVLSVCFWGSTIAVSRSLTESLGLVTTAAGVYLGAPCGGRRSAICWGAAS
jgi:hypothetical protein